MIRLQRTGLRLVVLAEMIESRCGGYHHVCWRLVGCRARSLVLVLQSGRGARNDHLVEAAAAVVTGQR